MRNSSALFFSLISAIFLEEWIDPFSETFSEQTNFNETSFTMPLQKWSTIYRLRPRPDADGIFSADEMLVIHRSTRDKKSQLRWTAVGQDLEVVLVDLGDRNRYHVKLRNGIDYRRILPVLSNAQKKLAEKQSKELINQSLIKDQRYTEKTRGRKKAFKWTIKSIAETIGIFWAKRNMGFSVAATLGVWRMGRALGAWDVMNRMWETYWELISSIEDARFSFKEWTTAMPNYFDADMMWYLVIVVFIAHWAMTHF
jgi:hypothetical protein